MTSSTFTKYQSAIKSYAGDPCATDLLMAQDGAVSVYYAPFEWVNPQARVVLVGITPGKTRQGCAIRLPGSSDLQVAHGQRADESGVQLVMEPEL